MMCLHNVCNERARCNEHNQCQPDPCTGYSQICAKECRNEKYGCDKYCRPNKCSYSESCPHGMACIYNSCQIVPETKCNFDYDCDDRDRCLDNDCVPRQCWNNHVCQKKSKHYTCYDGMCIPIGKGKCKKHNDCQDTQLCINGRCNDFCNVHEDCRPISCICINNHCHKPPPCNERHDCRPWGLQCIKGVCTEVSISIPCANDLECHPGSYCIIKNGVHGVCINTCRFHYECPMDSICTMK